MRRFIEAVKAKYADRSNARFQKMLIADWIEWANRIVDWKDPLKENTHLEIEEKDIFIRKLNHI